MTIEQLAAPKSSGRTLQTLWGLRQPRLDMNATDEHVLCNMLKFMGADGVSAPSVWQLERSSRLTEKTIVRAIDRLVAMGALVELRCRTRAVSGAYRVDLDAATAAVEAPPPREKGFRLARSKRNGSGITTSTSRRPNPEPTPPKSGTDAAQIRNGSAEQSGTVPPSEDPVEDRSEEEEEDPLAGRAIEPPPSTDRAPAEAEPHVDAKLPEVLTVEPPPPPSLPPPSPMPEPSAPLQSGVRLTEEELLAQVTATLPSRPPTPREEEPVEDQDRKLMARAMWNKNRMGLLTAAIAEQDRRLPLPPPEIPVCPFHKKSRAVPSQMRAWSHAVDAYNHEAEKHEKRFGSKLPRITNAIPEPPPGTPVEDIPLPVAFGHIPAKKPPSQSSAPKPEQAPTFRLESPQAKGKAKRRTGQANGDDAKARYRNAFERGMCRALGRPFGLDGDSRHPLNLVAICKAHGLVRDDRGELKRDGDGNLIALGGDALEAWLESEAEAFSRYAPDDKVKFNGGWTPKGLLWWLNEGSPNRPRRGVRRAS